MKLITSGVSVLILIDSMALARRLNINTIHDCDKALGEEIYGSFSITREISPCNKHTLRKLESTS